jgi:hypothetical protein
VLEAAGVGVGVGVGAGAAAAAGSEQRRAAVVGEDEWSVGCFGPPHDVVSDVVWFETHPPARPPSPKLPSP